MIMTDNVYQHDGSVNAIEFARKVAADYDARDICEPFAIIDLDVVKRQLDLWNFALPSVKPFYAVKCNPDLNILKTLSAYGACFDCASITEIKLVLSNNLAKSSEIILAHPIKPRQCIEYAIENGVTMMAIDSVEELRKVARITKRAKLILRIKVRGFDALVDLNKKFGADEVTSKLIFREAKKIGAKIHGTSFHIGSGVVNCRPVALSLANARKLLDYGRMLGHPVDIIDIGGGFVPTSNAEFLKPFYAVKCNPDLNILKTLSAYRACFDCASIAEIKLVLSNNLAKSSEIILAHPIKSRQCIEYSIENGVTMMTIDGVEELRKVARITKRAKLILRIKVRGFDALVDLNKKFGADEVTSKLIFREAKKIGAKIHGISFHIGSGVVNCRPVALSLANARKLLDYGRMLGHPVDIIDIGGGFVPTSNAEFLKVGHFIENSLSTCFEGVAVSVIAEPGRFLVTNAQYVATRVSQVVLKSFLVTNAQYVATRVSQVVLKSTSEDLPESYSIYLNDGIYGSFNFVLTEQRKATGFPLFKEREGHMRADIWGPTCCSFDIIEADRRISTVREGDWILYPDCGAYSLCLSTHFNGFHPPKVLYLISSANWQNIEDNERLSKENLQDDNADVLQKVLSKL